MLSDLFNVWTDSGSNGRGRPRRVDRLVLSTSRIVLNRAEYRAWLDQTVFGGLVLRVSKNEQDTQLWVLLTLRAKPRLDFGQRLLHTLFLYVVVDDVQP